jgi:hypothetical protein
MNDQNNQPQTSRPHIDYWRKIRTVCRVERDINRVPLLVEVTIERPVFVGGDEGFFRINATLKIDKHYIRLSTRAFRELLDIVHDYRSDFLEAFDEVRDRNATFKRDQEKSESSNGEARKERQERPPYRNRSSGGRGRPPQRRRKRRSYQGDSGQT